jgi:hypothetical protein
MLQAVKIRKVRLNANSRRTAFKCLALPVAGLLALTLGGCCSGGMMHRNIKLSLGQSLRQNNTSTSSIIVDLVGVNGSDYQRWYNYAMTKYFTAGNPLRAGATKAVVHFTPGGPAAVTFSKHNPIWRQWKAQGDTHLFILASLPGLRQDLPGAEDSRRLILPFDRCRWPGSANPIKVAVKNSGLVCLTPPKAKH